MVNIQIPADLNIFVNQQSNREVSNVNMIMNPNFLVFTKFRFKTLVSQGVQRNPFLKPWDLKVFEEIHFLNHGMIKIFENMAMENRS